MHWFAVRSADLVGKAREPQVLCRRARTHATSVGPASPKRRARGACASSGQCTCVHAATVAASLTTSPAWHAGITSYAAWDVAVLHAAAITPRLHPKREKVCVHECAYPAGRRRERLGEQHGSAAARPGFFCWTCPRIIRQLSTKRHWYYHWY